MPVAVGICGLWASSAFALGFPTAEGYGMNAWGGRGGSVYHVTNLNDDGAGSFRWACAAATDHSTIVFDVGGTINLQSDLYIADKDYITIAGQSAPGSGIQIAGAQFGIGRVENFIMRYMRFRPGNAGAEKDALNIFDSEHVMIDHVSTAWGTDETLSVTNCNNVTVQHSIIAQTLNTYDHSYGSLIRGSDAGGYYTFHHNLWAMNNRRNPAIGSKQDSATGQLHLHMSNNVVYDWGARTIHNVQSQDDLYVNLFNNMFIADANANDKNEILKLEGGTPTYDADIYLCEGNNLIDEDKDGTHDPTAVDRGDSYEGVSGEYRIYFTNQLFSTGDEEPVTYGANDAYYQILAGAGASLHRDSLDSTILYQTQYRTGSIINTAPSHPYIAGGVCPTDTDQDGIPDSWENVEGLNPNYAADGAATAANGYSNLDNYLCWIVGEYAQSAQFSPVPEPSTLVLLAIASIALLVRRRMAK